MDVEQVHAREQRARRVHVHVGVVEAGRDESAREVDGARPWPCALPHLGGGTHGGDAITRDGQALGPGPARVERVDASVDEDEVGRLRGGGGRGQGKSENQRQSAHHHLHTSGAIRG